MELREQVGQIEELEVLETLLVQAVTAQSLEAFETATEQSTVEVMEGEQGSGEEETKSQLDN